jgi:hypothetical protein
MSFTLTFNTAQSSTTLTAYGNTFTATDGTKKIYTQTTSTTITALDASLKLNTQLVSLTNIPSTVTSISDFAFSGCTSLATFVIPATVTSIGIYILENTAITSIVISSNTQNHQMICINCTSLTSVTLSPGLNNVSLSAFQGCTALRSIVIPSSVTYIDRNAFGGCTSLASITILNKATTFGYAGSFPPFSQQPFLNIANPATVYTALPLDNTNAVYTYFTTAINLSSGQVMTVTTVPPYNPIPCFKLDTKILTNEGYRPVQDLRKGDLVQTCQHGLIPINMIGHKVVTNSKDATPVDKLFVCSPQNYPEVFEHLYITGLHSILVDDLTEEQESSIYELIGKIYVTDNKLRLPIFMDKKAKMHDEEGEYDVYHIALDHEHELMNYGIYANGLLVETCCIKYLRDLSRMTILE